MDRRKGKQDRLAGRGKGRGMIAALTADSFKVVSHELLGVAVV